VQIAIHDSHHISGAKGTFDSPISNWARQKEEEDMWPSQHVPTKATKTYGKRRGNVNMIVIE
jgi:hypothetical protein